MMKSNTTRRSVVAMLGLTPVAAGFDAQSFVEPTKLDSIHAGAAEYNKEKFAQALERLAAAVRDETVAPTSLKLESVLEADSFLNQYDLTFKFLWQPDPPQS